MSGLAAGSRWTSTVSANLPETNLPAANRTAANLPAANLPVHRAEAERLHARERKCRAGGRRERARQAQRSRGRSRGVDDDKASVHTPGPQVQQQAPPVVVTAMRGTLGFARDGDVCHAPGVSVHQARLLVADLTVPPMPGLASHKSPTRPPVHRHGPVSRGRRPSLPKRSESRGPLVARRLEHRHACQRRRTAGTSA